jgi:hypothetical protein
MVRRDITPAGGAISGTLAPAARNARAAPGWKTSTRLAPALAARVPAAMALISRAGSVAASTARTSASASASGRAALPTTKFQAAKLSTGVACPR